MLRTLWLAAVLATAIMLVPGAAVAARLALVIGVNDYVSVPRLEKAVGDAQAMAAKLETLGFTVTQVLNPDRRSLNQAISAFQRLIKPGDDVLVHFSGHGVEVDGNNLLLPVDVPLPEPGDKDFLIGEAISLGDLMQRVADTHAATQVFVIDACRDNPFATKGGRGIGGTRGLAAVIPPTGAFVLYSAGRGQAALDKLNGADTAPTSVYTRVLIETMGEPGMSLAGIARSVRTRVAALAESVKHDQDPAYYDELTGDFFFVEDEPSGSATQTTTATTPPSDGTSDTARQDYIAAEALDTVEAWTTFLKYHSDGYYADLGKVALDKLSGAAAGAVTQAQVRELIEYISSDAAPQNLSDFVQRTYAARVDYYGKPASRADVLADKQRWYARWSSWKVEPHYETLVLEPDGDEVVVSYQLDYTWFPLSASDEPRSGAAKARLVVRLNNGRLEILSESSAQLKEQDQASLGGQDLGNLVLDPGAADGNYYVFIGAFGSREGAENMRRGLGRLADTATTLRTNDYGRAHAGSLGGGNRPNVSLGGRECPHRGQICLP